MSEEMKTPPPRIEDSYLSTIHERLATCKDPLNESVSIIHRMQSERVLLETELTQAKAQVEEALRWHEGYPDRIYGSEWFIACLDNGEKIVLRQLPEDFSYDYKTADETYY